MKTTMIRASLLPSVLGRAIPIFATVAIYRPILIGFATSAGTIKLAMKSITKQEAQEFKARWKFVNDFIAHQIRNTPSETKLQQLSAIFIIGQSRSPAFLAEEQ